jgi:hypothetical protein
MRGAPFPAGIGVRRQKSKRRSRPLRGNDSGPYETGTERGQKQIGVMGQRITDSGGAVALKYLHAGSREHARDSWSTPRGTRRPDHQTQAWSS